MSADVPLNQITDRFVAGFWFIGQLDFEDGSNDSALFVGIEKRNKNIPSFRLLEILLPDAAVISSIDTDEFYTILAKDEVYGTEFKRTYTSVPSPYDGCPFVDYGKRLKSLGHKSPMAHRYSPRVKFAEIGDDILAIIAQQPYSYRNGQMLPLTFTVDFLDLKNKTFLDAHITLDDSDFLLHEAPNTFYSEADQTLYMVESMYENNVNIAIVYTLPVPNGDVRNVESTTLYPKKQNVFTHAGANYDERGYKLYKDETTDFIAECRDATLYVKNKKTGVETVVFTGRSDSVKLINNYGPKLFGFVDDTYLIYNIFGYESTYGFGIYNVKTGKNSCLDNSRMFIHNVYNGIAYTQISSVVDDKRETTIYAIPLDNPEMQIPLGSVIYNTYSVTLKISNGILYIYHDDNGSFSYIDISDFTPTSKIPPIVKIEASSATYRSATKNIYLAPNGRIYIKES